MEKYLEAGLVVNTHGVRGDVKVKNYCDSVKAFAGIGKFYIKTAAGFKELRCEKNQPFGPDMALVRFEGCQTFEDAVIYKNKLLYADRDDIPRGEGDYFIADLIGLPVTDVDTGEVYGKLTDVYNQGAQDLYEFEKEDGTRGLIPAVPEFIIRIEPGDAVYVRPIEGLI